MLEPVTCRRGASPVDQGLAAGQMARAAPPPEVKELVAREQAELRRGALVPELVVPRRVAPQPAALSGLVAGAPAEPQPAVLSEPVAERPAVVVARLLWEVRGAWQHEEVRAGLKVAERAA